MKLMKQIARMIHLAPFFTLLVVTACTASVVSAAGMGRQYDASGVDFVRKPVLSLFFEGLKEGKYPWSTEGGAGAGAVAEQAAQSAADGSGAVQAPEGASDVGSIGASDGAQSADGSGGAQTPDGAAGGSISVQEAGSGETSAAAGETDGAAGSASSAGIEAGAPETTQQRDASYIAADSEPEGVNNKVVGAVDYGVAGSRYLDAAGTVYNTDTAGMFAPNGEYYRMQKVEDSYFSDALFIGDSRTDGLADYGGMKGMTTFFAKDALSIYQIWDQKAELRDVDGGGETVELLILLSQKSYRKIYLSLGINELGVPATTAFYEKYRSVLETIRGLQPDAIIYIEGIMHVAKEKSASDPAFNNTVIVQRNQAIATLANGHDIFYIDMNSAVCDENGDIPKEGSGDGVHLKASWYPKWHEFLLENAIVRSPADNSGGAPGVKETAAGEQG